LKSVSGCSRARGEVRRGEVTFQCRGIGAYAAGARQARIAHVLEGRRVFEQLTRTRT